MKHSSLHSTMTALLKPKWVISGIIVLMAGTAGAASLWIFGDLREWMHEALELVGMLPQTLTRVHPLFLVLAVAVLPLVGVPVSILVVAGGIAYGIWAGCLYAMMGITLNNVLGYLIAACWFHAPVARLMARQGWSIPVLDRNNLFRVIVAFRLTPGFPLTAQNYLLGMARVNFQTYLIASFIVQVIPVTGFVITGGSLFEGRWGLILFGLCLLLAAGLLAKALTSLKTSPH